MRNRKRRPPPLRNSRPRSCESPSDATPSATAPPTDPAQGPHTGVDAVPDEDDAATHPRAGDTLTGSDPAIHRTVFTGDICAVVVQVQLVISAYGPGGFTTPHVQVETATQHALQAIANRKVHTRATWGCPGRWLGICKWARVPTLPRTF